MYLEQKLDKTMMPIYLKIHDKHYQPHLDISQWWSLERDAIFVEELEDDLDLTFHFDTISLQQMSLQRASKGAFND